MAAHSSILENSVDRGAWRATVHGAVESQTQLSIAQNLDFDITEMAIFFLPGKPHGQRCWFQNSWT